GVAAAIVAAFVGSGALGGTPINEAAGGALSADATPVAPAGSAFGIWSVIYLGLAAYALWQLSPTARRSTCQRLLRPWALLSALLNAAWIWSVQLDLLVVSVAVIMVLLAVLVRIVMILGAPRASGWLETLLTDGTFGLYLGWVTVAFLANVYAWLADAGAALVTEIPLGLVGVLRAGGWPRRCAASGGSRPRWPPRGGWGGSRSGGPRAPSSRPCSCGRRRSRRGSSCWSRWRPGWE